MKVLLNLVTGLWEGLSRLRCIRVSEKEIGQGNHTLPSLRQTQKPTMAQETKDLSSCHQAEGDPGDGGEWKQVTAQDIR